MKKRALISVSDKKNIVEFAGKLTKLGYEIISTGGTYKILRENNIDAVEVSAITGFPECLDGRVKTLHPKIHAGILAMRGNDKHMAQLKEQNIDTIDIVVINLYPFKETISKENCSFEDAIENIDIGGPTMLRAAAKNYQDVAVIVDNDDFDKIIDELENGGITLKTKELLAYKVFEHTAYYDALIANYLFEKQGFGGYPDKLTLTFEKKQELRYGENPHQDAVYYSDGMVNEKGLLIDARQIHGKELSFNNINDTNGALSLLKEFSDNTAVVAVKHANPCGVAIADNIYDAYMRAYEADPVSIYGGIIAANSEIDAKTAEEMNKIFIEIIIAPSFSEEAVNILTKKPNIRLLELKHIKNKQSSTALDIKKTSGGLLVQRIDSELYNESDVKYVTELKPTNEQMIDLNFAFKVVKHTKSNAIVLVKDNMTVGIGPGQTNRITALELAAKYAGDKAKGSVMASDAYFPFSDCVKFANEIGVKAIIQPGGSIRDEDSIKLCNELGISMIFTEKRHFKH